MAGTSSRAIDAQRGQRVGLGFLAAFGAAAVLGVSAIAGAALADDEVRSAGVLAYSRVQGRVFVLLADHRSNNRGWGLFGGERAAGEAVGQAALREFREETRCAYDGVELPRFVAGRRIDHGSSAVFVIEVPFLPVRVFGSAERSKRCRGSAYRERGPWAWVPVGPLLEAAATKKRKLPKAYLPRDHERKLRERDAQGLLRAARRGLLPRS
jgi:8-oxo-dGTP pyrophosphatase MutT (NUDIX family)